MTMFARLEADRCGCDAPRGGRALVTVDEALRRIAAGVGPVVGAESVPLSSAQGRILAAPVHAAAPAPPFDNAAMDGYAVATATFSGAGPWMLALTDRVPAGQAAGAPLPAHAAARIFTGAPVPAGADAVIAQEDVRRSGDAVVLSRRPAPGLNIRRAGEDMEAGAAVLAAGRRLGPREIAACAAAGAAAVMVRRRIRVALLATGDEIRATGADRAEAQIWDVNTPMLSAMLNAPCCEVVRAESGADDPDGLRRQLAAMATAADLVVTTGGVSAGEADHVRPAVRALGGEIAVSGVALKPGKPFCFGRIGGAWWLGLPGNPLAAFVTWRLFGDAALRRLAGREGGATARRHVVAGGPVVCNPARCEARPARIAGFDGLGREVARFDEATHSGRVAGLPDADGLILLPAGAGALPEGALVEFLPFCET